MKYFNIPIKGCIFRPCVWCNVVNELSEYKGTTIFDICKIFLDFFKKYLVRFVYY